MNKETPEEIRMRILDELAEELGYADFLQIEMTDHDRSIKDNDMMYCYENAIERYHTAMLSQSIPTEEDELRVMGCLIYHLSIHQETYSKWHHEDIARVLLKMQKQLLNY